MLYLPYQRRTQGSPWGALHELAQRGGKPLAPGAPFGSVNSGDPRIAPWLELLHSGSFSESTLETLAPVSYLVNDFWMQTLVDAINAGKDSWLARLHLATCHLERGEVEPAREHLRKSIELKPNVVAARNLAVAAPNATVTRQMYAQAWSIWEQGFKNISHPSHLDTAKLLGKDLAREMCAWYTASSRFDDLRIFLSKPLPDIAGLQTKDQVLHAKAALAVHDAEEAMAKNPKGAVELAHEAISILTSNCFPTYGTMRSQLLNLWLRAQVLKERFTLGGKCFGACYRGMGEKGDIYI